MFERGRSAPSVAAFRRRFTRSLVPSLVLRAAAVNRAVRQRWAATRAAFGVEPLVELYLAFDDPYGAVALPRVAELARRHRARLVVWPVVSHGIAGDPDLPLRRAHAVTDASRLLARSGETLARREPLDPEQVRFLAEWTEAARPSGKAEAFALEAMSALWLSETAAPSRDRYGAMYARVVSAPPPATSPSLTAGLERNAARLRSRGHWETPAARIAGEWFFAHERLAEMADVLARLGG